MVAGRSCSSGEPACSCSCDISPNCLDVCRQRLAGRGRLRTHLSQAALLPADLVAAVDTVWSYDCLVHVAPEECRLYVTEIARVLRPGGTAVLHHAGGGRDIRAYVRARLEGLVRRWWRRDGGPAATAAPDDNGKAHDHRWRSAVSPADVRSWAQASGLRVVCQERGWTWRSPRGPLRIGVPRFRDCITVLYKPRWLGPT